LIAALLAGATALAGTPKASSELKDDDGTRHTARQAFDGLLSTGWAEGEMGDGTDAWLELSLDRTTAIESVSIWPGNMSMGDRSLREFGRPRVVKITLLGGDEEVSVDATLLDPGQRGALRQDVEIIGNARSIRLDFVEVIPGGIYNDLFVAEVALNFMAGATPQTVDKLNGWLESDSGKRAIDKNHEEVVVLYDQIGAAEFGDRDALQELMDRAGDGAPYRRRQVVSMVPAGFRVHALPPDDSSVEALLKIKDSNAIPAIERAALRSRGTAARTLRQQVEIFNAYQDLVGGGRFNIPPYGITGWEKGALQAFGEPMPIEVDVYASVWVGDVGNSRVQRFSYDGIPEKVYGHAEPTITNDWFQDTRTHYVSGSTPGTEPGEFSQPIDLCRIPQKNGDWIGVLDARARVTLIDDAGNIAGTITAPTQDKIISGVGGEGHLEWVKGELVIIWGNEGWVYSLEGEELAHFDLEDGSPTGAVAYKNGVAVIYGKALVLYNLDNGGYRQGEVMRGVHGEGYEAWEINIDNRGKYWGVSVKGLLYKL
jgi:hypothetical protein